MSGKTLGHYELIEEIGRGGMGTVYRARDPRLNREVAIKVLPPQFTHDPDFYARFEREANTIASLDHNAIVPVYDFGESGGFPYFVMRLLDGTLQDRIARGPIPPQLVVNVIGRVCAALDKAHGRGVIHRDVKPSNILLDEDGYSYLADFGIVRLAEMTRTVTMIGTAEYMTPEQVRGEVVDYHSDIYQCAVVVFEMLTGVQPYQGDSTAAVLYKIAYDAPPPLLTLNADVPRAWEQVISRALAKQPQERHESAGAFAQALAAAMLTAAEPAVPQNQPGPEPPGIATTDAVTAVGAAPAEGPAGQPAVREVVQASVPPASAAHPAADQPVATPPPAVESAAAPPGEPDSLRARFRMRLQAQTRLTIWASWTLATTLGLGLGYIFSLSLAYVLSNEPIANWISDAYLRSSWAALNPWSTLMHSGMWTVQWARENGTPFSFVLFIPLLAGLCASASVALAQRFVLRRLLPNLQHWILYTAAAAGIATLASYVIGALGLDLDELAYHAPYWLLVVLIPIVCISVGQSIALRASCSRAAFWIPVSVAAWLIAEYFVYVRINAGSSGLGWGWVSGLIAGALSGVGLVLMCMGQGTSDHSA